MIGSYGAVCAAIRKDSVSLLKFPFLSQVQVFWCVFPNGLITVISKISFFCFLLFKVS